MKKNYMLLGLLCFICGTLLAVEKIPSPDKAQPGEIWPDDRGRPVRIISGS